MASYNYVAVDPHGTEKRGALDVATQMEAIRRVREMGLFPVLIKTALPSIGRRRLQRTRESGLPVRFAPVRLRIKSARLVIFTRQLATMIGAGMSLLRALRILEEQEECRRLRRILSDLSAQVENGASFSEALMAFPRTFNTLFINLILAGETSGALDGSLNQLAGFLEKSLKLKGKLKAAMFYPCSVVVVAMGVMALLMMFVVPRFESVFDGLLEGRPLPAFTRLVFDLSNVFVHRMPTVLLLLAVVGICLAASLRTSAGALLYDRFKLRIPLLGPLFRKAAISRFARTLGTLTGNGVPILQALTIVKETAGNLILGQVISGVHEQVKQGEMIAPVLKRSKVFPPLVAGLVDVGEQTGALPEMLLKVADAYDDEFDNGAKGLMSLLEPVLIVALALLVGSIVIAMFLPLISATSAFDTARP